MSLTAGLDRFDHAAVERCATCRAPIHWAVTDTGANMPINPAPHPRGNLYLAGVDPDGRPRVRVITTATPPAPDRPAYQPHFATCRAADRHRRPPTPGAPRCEACGLPMNAALYTRGHRTHPCCDPADTRGERHLTLLTEARRPATTPTPDAVQDPLPAADPLPLTYITPQEADRPDGPSTPPQDAAAGLPALPPGGGAQACSTSPS